jgi:hypothetical protein
VDAVRRRGRVTDQVLDTGGVGRSRRDAVKKITNPGPPKGRHTRHIAEASCHGRMHAYAADLRALKSLNRQTQSPRLGVVDLGTGEIKEL